VHGGTMRSSDPHDEQAMNESPQESASLPVTLVGGLAPFHAELSRHLAQVPFLAAPTELPGPLPRVDVGSWDALELEGPGYVLVDVDPAPREAFRLIATVAERRPDLRVVAFGADASAERILEAVRSGASEFVPKPVDERVLLDALLRLRRHVAPRTEAVAKPAARVLSFFSAKGGTGSTTVATNVAVSLARNQGKSVLLVDLDLQLGEAALFLGLKPRYSLVDLVSNLHRTDEALLKTFVVKHESGVHLLAGPDAPDSGAAVGAEQIGRALQLLRSQYDYLVLDVPNNALEYVYAVLDQSDQIFLVCTADLPSLKNIQRTIGMLEKLGVPKNRLQVLLNRYDRAQQGVDRNAVERIAGREIFASIPNDYPTVMRSINSGIPLASTNHTEISRSFAELTQRLGESRPRAATRERKNPLAFLSRD
jgi:pilus assembly protein CpaE